MKENAPLQARGKVLGSKLDNALISRPALPAQEDHQNKPRVFTLTLAASPSSDAIRGLRRVLKFALRRCGLRAIHCQELAPEHNGIKPGGIRDRALRALMTKTTTQNAGTSRPAGG